MCLNFATWFVLCDLLNNLYFVLHRKADTVKYNAQPAVSDNIKLIFHRLYTLWIHRHQHSYSTLAAYKRHIQLGDKQKGDIRLNLRVCAKSCETKNESIIYFITCTPAHIFQEFTMQLSTHSGRSTHHATKPHKSLHVKRFETPSSGAKLYTWFHTKHKYHVNAWPWKYEWISYIHAQYYLHTRLQQHFKTF